MFKMARDRKSHDNQYGNKFEFRTDNNSLYIYSPRPSSTGH